MSKQFEYTTMAQRFTARFPLLSFVGIQVTFWIVANVLLIIILRLYAIIISDAFDVPVAGQTATTITVSVILGVIYGVGLGLTGYYLDKHLLKNMSLGRVLFIKTFVSLCIFVLVLLFFRYFLFDIYFSSSLSAAGFFLSEKSWDYLFYLLLIYYFFMTLVISFINQVNKKYGPGVLLPLLLGRYRQPREEERIFMFMDLKSSTSTAEKLGHLKYSAFIRDCFADINQVLFQFSAQVYQYVGDEIVLMWPAREGLKNNRCIHFYFAVQKRFEERSSHYLDEYGLLPDFKAGVHVGKVTAVEIGEIKRDIAYHGDTLNTAARIQSVCNDCERHFLASADLIKNLPTNDGFEYEHLGATQLKGKAEKVAIVSVTSSPQRLRK